MDIVACTATVPEDSAGTGVMAVMAEGHITANSIVFRIAENFEPSRIFFPFNVLSPISLSVETCYIRNEFTYYYTCTTTSI